MEKKVINDTLNIFFEDFKPNKDIDITDDYGIVCQKFYYNKKTKLVYEVNHRDVIDTIVHKVYSEIGKTSNSLPKDLSDYVFNTLASNKVIDFGLSINLITKTDKKSKNRLYILNQRHASTVHGGEIFEHLDENEYALKNEFADIFSGTISRKAIPITVGMNNLQGGHANALLMSIVNINTVRLYHYEPHGSEQHYKTNRNHRMEIVIRYITRLLKKYHGITNVLGNQYGGSNIVGIQTYLSVGRNHSNIQDRGYCLFYSLFWLYTNATAIHLYGSNFDPTLIEQYLKSSLFPGSIYNIIVAFAYTLLTPYFDDIKESPEYCGRDITFQAYEGDINQIPKENGGKALTPVYNNIIQTDLSPEKFREWYLTKYYWQ
jgi:hypothetical protein